MEHGRVYRGPPVTAHLRTLQARAWLPVDRLLTASSDDFSRLETGPLLYAQCWALVHYLLHGPEARRGQLDRYAALLNSGVPERQARDEALGNWSALGRELEGYVLNPAGSLRWYELPLPIEADARTAPERAVSPGESLGIRAGYLAASGRPAEARTLAAEALRAEPGVAAAHEALATAAWRDGRRAEALEQAEKAIASPGASEFAHQLHALLLWPKPGDPLPLLEPIERSLRRSLTIYPGLAWSQSHLALIRDARGAPAAETLPLAVRAAALDPTDIGLRVNALRLAAKSSPSDALAAAEQQLAVVHGDQRKVLEDFVAQLRQQQPPPSRTPPSSTRPEAPARPETSAGPQAPAAPGYLRDDPDQARPQLERECARGDKAACLWLGSLLWRRSASPADAARATALLDAACREGTAAGCSELAGLLLARDRTPDARKRATELYRRACDGGYAPACARIGAPVRQ